MAVHCTGTMLLAEDLKGTSRQAGSIFSLHNIKANHNNLLFILKGHRHTGSCPAYKMERHADTACTPRPCRCFLWCLSNPLPADADFPTLNIVTCDEIVLILLSLLSRNEWGATELW